MFLLFLYVLINKKKHQIFTKIILYPGGQPCHKIVMLLGISIQTVFFASKIVQMVLFSILLFLY